MNLVPYKGFDSVGAAVGKAESVGMSRNAIVIVRYLGEFYVVASGGADKNAILGSEISFRRSRKDGTFKIQPLSKFKLSYSITERQPRRYTDTIFREMEHRDPDVALFTMNDKGSVREIAPASNVNYPVLLGLSFKRVVVPVEELLRYGLSYFKGNASLLEEVVKRFDGKPHRHFNPFTGIAYNPEDPKDFMFYGFTFRSQFGPRFDSRRPSPFEVELFADSVQQHPIQPTPQGVLAMSSMPVETAYQGPRRPFNGGFGRRKR